MGRFQRPTIRNHFGKKVRITYHYRDLVTNSPIFNRDETYDGVLELYHHVSEGVYPFNGKNSFSGCIKGSGGRRFCFLPIDGPLHCVGKTENDNGYWSIDVLE
jgi:hypothetical protein